MVWVDYQDHISLEKNADEILTWCTYCIGRAPPYLWLDYGYLSL
jgi:hypothetical protein